MAWFKVDDGFHSSRKVLSIPRRTRLAAVGAWALAGAWCADELTDGRIPDYMISEWGFPPSVVDALVTSGLWEREHGSLAFCNWAEYQPSKADVDAEREASRERMRELRAKRKQKKPQDDAAKEEVFGRTVTNGSENVRNPDPTRPDPTHIEVPKGTSSSRNSVVQSRPEIDALMDLLDSELAKNNTKLPSRTKQNVDAARLLVDRDGYTVAQVEYLIRWSQADEFWRANIRSMSKLREKADTLRLQSQRQAQHAPTSQQSSKADEAQDFISRLEAIDAVSRGGEAARDYPQLRQ